MFYHRKCSTRFLMLLIVFYAVSPGPKAQVAVIGKSTVITNATSIPTVISGARVDVYATKTNEEMRENIKPTNKLTVVPGTYAEGEIQVTLTEILGERERGRIFAPIGREDGSGFKFKDPKRFIVKLKRGLSVVDALNIIRKNKLVLRAYPNILGWPGSNP